MVEGEEVAVVPIILLVPITSCILPIYRPVLPGSTKNY